MRHLSLVSRSYKFLEDQTLGLERFRSYLGPKVQNYRPKVLKIFIGTLIVAQCSNVTTFSLRGAIFFCELHKYKHRRSTRMHTHPYEHKYANPALEVTTSASLSMRTSHTTESTTPLKL
jgi:hypothetical protein